MNRNGKSKEVESDLTLMMNAVEDLKRQQAEQDFYSKLRSNREKATFSMMMKMNPDALTNIRKEFFARRDSVTLEEFIYIIQKHLVNKKGDESFVMETPEQREFGTNMYELFKDIDVNGDGQLEWQEFTSFTVEKANLLNKRQKLTSIAHYHDSTHTLDPSAHYRHRHDIARFVNIPQLCQFAIVEDHKNSIYVFNSRIGKHTATIQTEAAPIAIESIAEKDRVSLVTSGADMTLSTFSLDDPNPKKRYKVQTSWATPGVQMALAYAYDSKLLYSGATNGNIYSWNVHDRNLVTTLSGHTDIVMNLIILQKLNNVASASLDKTVSVWDSHTNDRILTLHGHKKGVFDLTYNPQHRLIFSCGFEHDACVWSPFVNSLVYRLKGHHASLVGCQSVENSHEVITADTSGIFKLWDVRNFSCVQTFSTNLSGQETKDSSKLTCFFHSKLSSRNALQEEDDSRIYAASKNLFSFDQARVVHEATTDYYNVCYMTFIQESSVIVTASEHNVIVWDGLIGSKTFTHPNISEDEISACCLDDRRRKIILGDIKGKIGVYNCSNGALMKRVHKSWGSTCVSLHYFDSAKRFIAGFARGQVCIYDENVLEECILIRQFECYSDIRMEPELKDTRRIGSSTGKTDKTALTKEMLTIDFDHTTHTIATAGATDGMLRLWDYDSSKCTAEVVVCDIKTSQIVFMKMLHPYPLLVTSDSSGNIILWGSKGTRWVGMRISSFLNMTPASAEHEPKSRHQDDNDSAPRRALPPMSRTPLCIRRAEETALLMAESDYEDEDVVIFHDVKASKSVHTETQTAAVEAFKEKSLLLAEKQYFNSEAKWGRCSAAHAMGWNAQDMLLITGDDLGHIRCFSLRDAMLDIQKDLLINHPEQDVNVLGLCRDIDRDDTAALAPIDHDISAYLLARKNDAMSYLGIRFRWSLYAHTDRIINCTCTPNGVLTSAADRLVKMWDFDGRPLGTLLQSVPIGTRSKTWDLLLDVKSIINNENKELNEIIERVSILAKETEKPNIANMDFTGMQLGEESANFSQSVLRQRIERTTKILGIDFPTTVNQQHIKNTSSNDDIYSVDLSTINESGSTINNDSYCSVSSGGKSLSDALYEIKSTDSGIDYEFKTKSMSYIQQRRKANKLNNLSKQYEEKSGVQLNVTNKEISIWEEEEENNNNKASVDFDKLLSTANTTPQRTDLTINDDMYSIELIEEQRRLSKTRHHHLNKAIIASKIADSIQQAHERGPRTISMLQSCKKHKGFGALNDAIQTNGGNKHSIELTEEELLEIRTQRERKIRSASTVNSSFLMNLKDRKSSTLLSAGLKVTAAAGPHQQNRGSVSSVSIGGRSARYRHNSADTECTEDSMAGSLRHQLTRLSVNTSTVGGDSPKSTRSAAGQLGGRLLSDYETGENTPYTVSAGNGFGSEDL